MPRILKRRRNFFHRTWSYFVDWSIRISAILLVSTIVAVHLDLIKIEVNLTLACVVLILFLAEQIRHDYEEAAIRQADLREITNSLYLASSSKLLTLSQCVDDLMVRIEECDQDKLLKIDHLGLDMTHAWDHVRDRLLEKPSFSQVEFRLLMISADEGVFSHAPDSVQDWSRAAKGQKNKILENIKEIESSFYAENKKFLSEIREYNEFPFIHGVHVSGPLDIYYLAFCRWGGKYNSIFQWGEMTYYRIPSGGAGDSVFEDLTKIFRGQFNHLWSISAHAPSVGS